MYYSIDADRWSYTKVHHSEEWDCWLVTAYDDKDDQVGDSDTDYRKSDAINTAQGYLDSDRCDEVRVYNKYGELQRTIKAGRKDMTKGTLTKTQNADIENGIEAKYEYEIDGMVYELGKVSERYSYMRSNARFASVGYRDVWRAHTITPEGRRYFATELTRASLIKAIEEQAA